jgi:hypothetical protein
VNITHGKKACLVAPDNFANGSAINPLRQINIIEATVNLITDVGSKFLDERDIKIRTGSAISTISLFEPDRSGLNLRL